MVNKTTWSRRAFLAGSAAAAAAPAFPRPAGLKIGVMDGVLGLPMKPEAFAKAKELGFEGMQVTLGRARKGTPLPLADAALQDALVAASKQSGVPIVSTYLDVLHDDCLGASGEASDRVLEGIRISRALNAPVLMTVFFGKCELKTHGATEKVVEAFRYLAPAAADEGIVLGFESLLTAKQTLYVIEKVNSPALKVYYDVGNAVNLIGTDPAAELQIFGADQICQLHFKDKGFLGEGKVDMPSIYQALDAIGYGGYGVLETASPTKNIDADLKRNLDYLARL